jgi:hypothetical protein
MSVAFEYGGIDRDPVCWVDQSGNESGSGNGHGYVSEPVLAAPAENAPAAASTELEGLQAS